MVPGRTGLIFVVARMGYAKLIIVIKIIKVKKEYITKVINHSFARNRVKGLLCYPGREILVHNNNMWIVCLSCTLCS